MRSPRSEQTEEELLVLGSAHRRARSHVLRERPGHVERRPAHDEVGARADARGRQHGRYAERLEGDAAVVPLEAAVTLEEHLRPGGQLPRADVAGHRGDERVGERPRASGEPPRIHDAVVVRERDQVARARLDAQVACSRGAGDRLEQVGHVERVAEPARGVGRRRIVDDDDLVRGRLERLEAAKAARQGLRPVARADDHRHPGSSGRLGCAAGVEAVAEPAPQRGGERGVLRAERRLHAQGGGRRVLSGDPHLTDHLGAEPEDDVELLGGVGDEVVQRLVECSVHHPGA